LNFKNKSKRLLLTTIPLLLLAGCGKIAVLNPQGPVAKQEAGLIYWSFGLMMIVVLAVCFLFVYMLVKYRDKPGNTAKYDPEMEGSRKLEAIWTVVPILIVVALAIPTVKTTYALTKPAPTVGDQTPLNITVTSVNWKWIFTYPQQGIETVNYVDIPAGVPVNFELGAIGPMNSFWVPELGGQEYDMPGMSLKLWLEATNPGNYLGRSANFSGVGFTHMTFWVRAKSETDFNAWVQHIKTTAPQLTPAINKKLLTPGNSGEMSFSSIINPTGNEVLRMPGMNMSGSSK